MTLSKTDTALLKGIAILMIVMHNFCHLLPGSVVENEYTYDASRILQYVEYLQQGGPHLILYFMSHYGHYGVPLFLFLSGYGLAKKYENPRRAEQGSALSFLLGHALKLWKLMLPAIAIYAVCVGVSGRRWTTNSHELLAMVTYTSNLFAKRDLILGPWWFFSLILQLYVIYRLLLYPTRLGCAAHAATRQWGRYVLPAVLTLGCLGWQCWLFYGGDSAGFNYWRYNFVGSMLPFALGVVAARMEQDRPQMAEQPLSTRLAGVVSLAGTILLLLSAASSALWMLSPIFLLMALVPMAELLRCAVLRNVLVWIGNISASLFALHPIVRAFTLRAAKAAELQGNWGDTYLYLLLYLALSLLAAWLLQRIINPKPLNL